MMSPFVIVIYGATGDLAKHKLFPAFYSLFKKGLLGQKFYLVGFARRPFTDQAFGEMIGSELKVSEEEEWKAFAKNVYYQQGLFDEKDGYEALIQKLNGFDTEVGACITRLFYLATPPDNYQSILHYLSSTKLSEGCGQGSEKWTRLAIEKPFGRDSETARALDTTLAEIFEEKQIYRIDHYLGKETMQNMIAFRFANSIFEPLWNKDYIDHVQIFMSQKEGVQTRGNFFDGVGMLRDVGQNHLLQMLATVAMEPPKTITKEEMRGERVKAIKSIQDLKPEEIATHVVRAQYNGYLAVKGVAPNSQTDTYIAMKLFINTPRFAQVPFYLRAGKKMKEEKIEIKIIFKPTSHHMFKDFGTPDTGNVLTIRIQPNEGITLGLIAKKPGNSLQLETVDMRFSYQQAFGSHGADAYEKIILDILAGDQMLFNRSDELASSWDLVSTILNKWEEDANPILTYEQGTYGPNEADELIEKDGRKWL